MEKVGGEDVDENRRLTLPPSSQTSACCLLRTFESKKPFLSPGAVFELVCLPIFVRWFVRDMCLGCQVSLSGYRYKAGKRELFAGIIGRGWRSLTITSVMGVFAL